jgi:hypothetical protein
MMVVSLVEHDDGSATVHMDMSAEEIHALIESAFRIALVKGLKTVEEQVMEEMKDERQEAKPDNWISLTDEEIDYYIINKVRSSTKENLAELIRFCEKKLKEKNT